MTEYKFMTFNMLTDSFFLPGNPPFAIRKNAVREMIETYQPDLIGVQEVNHHMLSEMSGVFDGYTSFGDSRHAVKADEYNLIFYRHDRFDLKTGRTLWLSDHPERKGSKIIGSQFPRIVTIANLYDHSSQHGFTFANTHLDANFSIIRQRQSLILLELLKQYSHGIFTVLTGDFNAIRGSREISILETEMQDLTDPSIGSTLRGKIGSMRNHQLPIDHILITPFVSDHSIQKITASYHNIYPSDHYPVLVKVRIP